MQPSKVLCLSFSFIHYVYVTSAVLPDVQVVQLYQTYHHSCCLYLGSVFVHQFSYEPECQPKLKLMFEVSLTLIIVSTVSLFCLLGRFV